jgi:hypothetical protein
MSSREWVAGAPHTLQPTLKAPTQNGPASWLTALGPSLRKREDHLDNWGYHAD